MLSSLGGFPFNLNKMGMFSALTVFFGVKGNVVTPVPPFIKVLVRATLYAGFVLSKGLQVCQHL